MFKGGIEWKKKGKLNVIFFFGVQFSYSGVVDGDKLQLCVMNN